jgi:hypothetical protein
LELLFVFELEFVPAPADDFAGFVVPGFVPADFVAAACVGVAVALELAAGADDGAVSTAPLLTAPMPAIDREFVPDSCGGVIDMTAPRPPNVPPAISNPRFISYLDS